MHEPPDGNDAGDKSARDWLGEQGDAFADGFMDTSETAQDAVAAWDKLGEYAHDPWAAVDDAKELYESLPLGQEIWQGAQDITAGAIDAGADILNDPAAAASAAGTWIKDQAAGACEDGKAAWQAGGAAQVARMAVGMVGEVISPSKKAKMLKGAAEAADELGDAARAKRKLDNKKATKNGKDGTGSTAKKPRNPCRHLIRGNGNRKYRGGAHQGTKGPEGDGLDSHHVPANSVTDLPRDWGPALQIEPSDSDMSGSNGKRGLKGERYRQELRELINNEKLRDALSKDVKDVRNIGRKKGVPKRYNEAIKEMLEYNKCLERHGIVPAGQTHQWPLI